jgi:hypothetical protein
MSELVVATHEAAHAAVAFELGLRVELVSIRPGMHFAGIMFHGSPPGRRGDSLRWAAPLPLQPAGLRRRIECKAMVALAGDIATWLYAGEVVDRTVSEDEAQARALVASITGGGSRTPREEGVLAREEQREEPPEGDEATARRLMDALTWDGTGLYWLHALRVETEALLRRERVRREALALRDELVARKAVGARAARRVLMGARGGAA